MSCLLLNIGNTHVLSAELLRNGSLSGFRTFETLSFDPGRFDPGETAVVSVVPRWETFFRKAGTFVLDSRTCAGVLSLEKMETPETVGADRIANAAALIATGPIPALCIDCGTAITFEFVDADRNLCGGAILPGRKLLRQALHDYTAKLPLVPFYPEIPQIPGRNTTDAIRIGTDSGAVGAVESILAKFRTEYPGLRVVLCGGDAPFFRPHLGPLEFCGSEFTLKGLAYAYSRCRSCR